MKELLAETAQSNFVHFGLKGFIKISAKLSFFSFVTINSMCFVCVCVCIALHCVGSQFPHVSAAEPEPLASSLQSPAGSSVVLNQVPEAT